MNTPGIETYRALEQELFRIRARHRGEESQEEEIHMSHMDVVWNRLSSMELGILNSERDLPKVIRELRPYEAQRPMVDTNVWLPRVAATPVRRERSLACS